MSMNAHKSRVFALIGNPNCGKTTVFNALTKTRQKVGNYPGVTVEKKTGVVRLDNNLDILVIDLPGTYSLAVKSPDEQVARDVLMGRMPDTPAVDAVICVVDATNLRRNLYLVSQVMDLGLEVILVVNMMDEAKVLGINIDVPLLSSLLGIDVVGMVATKQQGIEQLLTLMKAPIKQILKRPWVIPSAMLTGAEEVAGYLTEKYQLESRMALGEALILLSTRELNPDNVMCADGQLMKLIRHHQGQCQALGINWQTALIEGRYAWIGDIIERCVKHTKTRQLRFSQRLDDIFTHPVLGWVSFLFFMGAMFYSIFALATIPMDMIDQGFSWLADYVTQVMPAGELRDLITGGIIAGVGGVVIFLPQILLLFFYIGLLQDTGYMARAAFIMDRLMRMVGLHGKSFIPLLSSFACAVPGIMATRTIEGKKDRLVTILIAPLMSCSARLPVYATMIAVLIPTPSIMDKVLLILGMYLLGILGAFVMAWIFKNTLLRSETPTFLMELPPYRWPSLMNVLLHMWERSWVFLKQAGSIILAVSILLWALMYYPHDPQLSSAQALEQSYAGRLGKVIEPIIEPLGFDWRIGVGLIGSLAAREVFVSTMSIIFNMEDQVHEGLQEAFRYAKRSNGELLFTPLVCLGLMVFYVFAMQCLSTTVTVRRETNSWRWPIFQFIYMTALAYGMTWIVIHGGRLLGFQ